MKLKKLKRPKIRIRRPRIRIRWRKRTSRWVIGAAILFFISLFALHFVLMNYTRSILQNALNLQLQQATGGKYVSDFDNIGINYTSKSFIIHNFRLVSRQQNQSAAVGGPDIYEVFAPEVRINGINLRKAYLDNFLDIESLQLLNPIFELKLNFDSEESKASPLLKADFYKILPKPISDLRIGQIQLKGASFTLSTLKNDRLSVLEAISVNTEFNNFHLNAQNAARAGKIFFTDNFFIAADSVQGSLSNQLYKLQLGTVKISSADSSAFISNLSLQPMAGPREVANKTSFNNLYELNFPQVYLYGLSFNDLYHTRDLLAKEATIISPSLQLYNLKPLEAGQKENFRLEDLYPAIDKLLNSIQVQDIYLRNGSLRIDELNENIQNKLVSQIALAHVRNFLLDSTANRKKDKLLYADELTIKLNRYSLRLSDELHLLQANTLSLSSKDNSISAEGFSIKPDSASERFSENIPLYNAQAANIRVLGVDMLQAYNNNILHIDSLLVNHPTFLLATANKKQEQEPRPTAAESFHEEDLYGLIQDYLYTLQINNIAVKQGRLQILRAKQSKSDGFFTRINQARLWNFRLDSASAYQLNKLFYANDFELEIAGYKHDLPDNIHTITAGKIGISTLNDQIIISNVRIRPSRHQYPYPNLRESPVKAMLNLEIPQLRLEGVDILKAYLEKQLIVEQVYIPAPAIGLGSLIDNQSERVNIIKSSVLYDQMKDYLELIQVQDLHLQEGAINLAFYDPNGLLTVSGQKTDVQIDNFRFDSLTSSNPKRLFFADNVRVKVEGYETRLSDNIHIIRAKNFVASTSEQEIRADNVAIINTREGYTNEELLVMYQKKGFLQLRLPELRISGVNFDKAYYEESLRIDSVRAAAPVVSYTYIPQASLQSRKKKVMLRQIDIYESMAPYLKKLTIGDLQMQNGRFYSFQQEDNQLQEHIVLEGLSLDMQDFHLDSTAIFDNQRFFYTDDIRLQVSNYRQELRDNVHRLTAQDLFLSTGQKKIGAVNIRLESSGRNNLKKRLKNAGNNQYSIHLPALEIEGISFDEVFRENRLFIENLSLRKPVIEVHQYTSAAGKEAPKNGKITDYELDELLQGNLAAFTVKEAIIEEGKGTYTLYKDNKKLEVRSQAFEAKVENFHLQKEEQIQDKPFNADNIQLKFKAVERLLADSLHLLRIEEISYSSREKRLQAKAIRLEPRPLQNLKEHMRSLGVNTFFKVEIPHSQVKGLEADRLEQDSLFLQYILLENPLTEITRFSDLLKKDTSSGQKKSWHQLLKDEFSLVQTDSIIVRNATAAFTRLNDSDTSYLEVGNLYGTAHNFRIDSMADKDNERLFYSDRIKAQILNYKTTIDDGLYELSIPLLTLDSEKESLVADSIKITPLTSRQAFAEQKGYETDQISLRNKRLTVKNLDYVSLLQKGRFEADSLLLDGFYLLVHREKNQPHRKNYRPKMPQELIRQLDMPLMLLGVEVKNGYIGYSEKIKGAREAGYIDLTNVHILSDTISNYPALLEKGLSTNLSLNTRLMGTGQLKAFFEIPLGDSLNRHRFKGTLDQMYLPDFNPILENTIFIKIRDGYVNQIRFAVEADKYEANGEMEFSYNDLNVALVNRRTGKTGGLVKEIGSLLANVFVVNSNNLETGKQSLRKGKMHYKREENQTTINYWIKTLIDGFKSSIGI
jgi:hypothetical protein